MTEPPDLTRLILENMQADLADLRDSLNAFRAELHASRAESDARWQASDARWRAQHVETLAVLGELKSQRERLERERLLRERNMRSVTEILEQLATRVRNLDGRVTALEPS